MILILIKGETSDGEPLEQTFEFPDMARADWRAAMYRHAVCCLWEARWIPGSVSWRCYTIDGAPFPVGENY